MSAAETRMEPQRLDLRPELNDRALARLRGARPSDGHFDVAVVDSTDAYDSTNGRLVFRFRKAAIPVASVDLARLVFGNIDERMRPSFRRKSAAGRLDLARIRERRPDVVALEPVGSGGFSGRFILASGKRLRDPMSNPVTSYLAGYNYDRYRGLGLPSGFTARFPSDWQRALPFFESVWAAFEGALPDVAERMRDWCRTYSVAPAFTIGETCLSTVAINVNYESCYHIDGGDLPAGYSTLTAMRVGGPYHGGLLVLPKYRVAIDIRDGDLLCNQSHIDLHGNTAVTPLVPGAKRLSFVTYLKKMLRYAKPAPTITLPEAP